MGTRLKPSLDYERFSSQDTAKSKASDFSFRDLIAIVASTPDDVLDT